jgi:molybdopterin-guanine dinucleotide biosynthesis protein A
MTSIINPDSVPAQNITGVVLAGGRASRMGGSDKGLLPLAGIPMIVRICDALALQVGDLLINVNRNQAIYTELTARPVVMDHIGHFAGPLAGIAAALQQCETPFLVAVPCDSPFLAEDLVSRLYHALCEQHAEIAIAMLAEKPQPVFVLLSRQLLMSLTSFLESGGRKIMDWYLQHRLARVDFSDRAWMFENINTPEEQQRIERQLQQAQWTKQHS